MKALLLAMATAIATTHAGGAHAATACLSNLTQLVLVLDAVSQTAQDDEIRMVGGTYVFSQVISATLQQPKNLLISGGWNGDCSMQDGGATVFDGQNQTRLLYLHSAMDGEVGVENITFVNATAATDEGDSNALGIYVGGVAIAARNTFLANHYDFGAAALGMHGDFGTWARSNLVVANHSGDFHSAIEMTCTAGGDGGCLAVGNTVFGNQANTVTSTAAGLRMRFAGGTAYVANNLLWNNQGADLYLAGATPILYDNDIGATSGDAPSAESEGNFSVAPIFAGGILNFRLASSSPTINRGRICIVNEIGCQSALGTEDIAGAARIQGKSVDIGAFESDVLFYDAFEQRP